MTINHTLHLGDCLDVLRTMADNSVDSIVTDPPYGLEFMGKDWDAPWKSDRRQTFDGTLGDTRPNPYGRSKVRFGVGGSYGGKVEQMQAFQSWMEEIFTECLRVLKPGGHLKVLFSKAPNPGRDEVVAAFPDAKGQQGDLKDHKNERPTKTAFGDMVPAKDHPKRGDTGSAARFFYCAKASRKDRNEGCESIEAKQYSHDGRETPIDNAYQRNSSNSSNSHPTVKPTDLMAYLCRLVTPPGGIVLDPFMGSGSTGKAALREGFRFVGIEREAAYMAIAQSRIEHEVARIAALDQVVAAPIPQLDLFAA